jgi:SAM-dependent methyltransferase
MASSRWKMRLFRFMRVKPICKLIFQIRFIYFMKIRRRFVAYGDETGVERLGHERNRRSILAGEPSERILKLIMPLSVIDRLDAQSRIVAIGCRYETDLLYLAAYGFDPKNIRGLDMFSYSPWVDLGNMHAMKYPDSTWDAVLLGWVLTYSDDPALAAREMVRVVRPGGLIAIGITTYPQEYIDELRRGGNLIGTTDKIKQVDDILAQFGDHVENIYFRHDRTDQSVQGHCLVIFSIKK